MQYHTSSKFLTSDANLPNHIPLQTKMSSTGKFFYLCFCKPALNGRKNGVKKKKIFDFHIEIK